MSEIDEALEALEFLCSGVSLLPAISPDIDMDALLDAKEKVRQALERQRVPKGWKLVPVKPTGAIFEAWCDAGLPPSINAMAKAWRKLLAAPEADDETS